MLRKIFGKDGLFNAFKRIGFSRLRMSHSNLLEISILSITLLLALMVRMLPIRWGFYLSEFDPYFHYRSAEYMVENGFAAWTSWRDYLRWYPYGTQAAQGSFPGVAISAAVLYTVAKALGLPMSLFELCVFFPVLMGTLTCLVMYFLGKDVGGKKVGLFSSFFLAFNASYIGRTSLGFFDDETIGIFSMLLFFFFFLRSIEKERPLRQSIMYAVLAGLSLGYLCTSWGATRYPISMTALFVFILILLRRYSSRLLLSYSVSFGITFFVAINVPKLGFGFLTETFNLTVPAIFLLLCLCELLRHIRVVRTKAIVAFTVLALFVVLFFALGRYGFIEATPGRFMEVLNPFGVRKPLVESIAEHKSAAWGSFYYEYGIGAFFIPVGLFFTIRDPTNRNIFLSIFALTTVYFASSMIRLTLLMSPAFCLLWAVALIRLLRPFVTIMRETQSLSIRGRRFRSRVGREFSAVFLIMMFILLMLTFAIPNPRPINHAYVPTTIASASTPIKPSETITDWINTLTWMRDNLPSTSVVACWWDYGYWITTLANKTTLADNGTVNMTQIGAIGLMYMSNETEAIEILRNFDTTHVMVFTTFYIDQEQYPYIMDRGWGDEGKWMWMAKIADSVYPQLNYSFGGPNDYFPIDFGSWNEYGNWLGWTDRGKDTVIYKLMTYGREERVGLAHATNLEHFDLVHLSQGSPAGGVYALVCVYEVKY